MTTRKGLKLALSLLPALALLFAAGTLSVAKAEYTNPFGVAVIIGNRTYAGDIPAVSFAHRDAEAFKRYVVDVLGFDPENVINLRDATQARTWSTFGSRTSPDRSDLWAYLDPDGNSDWWCTTPATAFRGSRTSAATCSRWMRIRTPRRSTATPSTSSTKTSPA